MKHSYNNNGKHTPLILIVYLVLILAVIAIAHPIISDIVTAGTTLIGVMQ